MSYIAPVKDMLFNMAHLGGLEQIAQRINMLRMFNVKELPFHIPGFTLPFVLKKEHVDLFLKKKDTGAKLPFGMYT
jgi:hypothetical protein